uniref:Uncharacterized protein n=1 Tax=Rhizophora mucronata TaxID=61149 RepID=A0A2P2PEW9_RHIMU
MYLSQCPWTLKKIKGSVASFRVLKAGQAVNIGENHSSPENPASNPDAETNISIS